MADETSDAAPQAGWSSRSIGRNWQHQFFYRLIRLGGRPTAYAALRAVALVYVLRRKYRERCTPYLERRFPGTGPRARFVHSYRMVVALGEALIDRAATGILGPSEFQVRFDESDELLDLLGQGRGLILMIAHVDCWQAAMSALENLPAQVSMLMRREDGDLDRHYFEHKGQTCPYRVIDPEGFLGGTLEMLGVLKAGQIVSVMGDRLLGSASQAVSVPFLGGAIRVPFSAYLLASATGAPVVILLSAKTGRSSYRLRLYRAISVPPGLPKKPQAYADYAGEFATCLEHYVGEYPYQFFNFYDLWSQPDHSRRAQ